MVKHLPTMQETWVRSLAQEDPLEKEMAPHSSTLAWKFPRTEEPGSLPSMGLQRVGHDWTTSLSYRLQKGEKQVASSLAHPPRGSNIVPYVGWEQGCFQGLGWFAYPFGVLSAGVMCASYRFYAVVFLLSLSQGSFKFRFQFHSQSIGFLVSCCSVSM